MVERLGVRIRRKRLRLGLTLDDLAARTGISKPYLSLIETGKVVNPPRDQKLRRLEAALDFPPGQLLAQAHLYRTPRDVRAVLHRLLAERRPGAGAEGGGAVDLDEAYLSGVLQEMVEQSAGNVQRVATVGVPVINRVSAGYPQDFTDLSYPRGVADEYISCPDLSDRDAFGTRVHGDSMMPKYRPGEVVVFSPAAAVRSGDDCFVRFADGHTTFKLVYLETDERGASVVRLQPRNERYRPQIIPGAHVAGIYRAMYRYQRVDED